MLSPTIELLFTRLSFVQELEMIIIIVEPLFNGRFETGHFLLQ